MVSPMRSVLAAVAQRVEGRYVVGCDCLETHIAWRSLVVSGLTVFVVAFFSVASESLFGPGHAALAGAFYVACFALGYPIFRLMRRRAVRPPLPAYFGETRVALLLMAYCLLAWGDPSLARSAYLAPCLSLVLGACVDAFWLSEVAGRRGVGLRQAVVAGRALRARPAGWGRPMTKHLRLRGRAPRSLALIPVLLTAVRAPFAVHGNATSGVRRRMRLFLTGQKKPKREN